MLRDRYVCLVGVLMSPFGIRADLSFSLSLVFSIIGMVSCCAWLEREWERKGECRAAFDSLHCISLIKPLPVPPPKIFTYPCTQPPTPFVPLGVYVYMRDDFSRRSLGCGFFFPPPEAELIIKIDLHIKSLREKHVLLPPSPLAHTLHPPIIIPAGGRRLQFLSIQTGNTSK